MADNELNIITSDANTVDVTTEDRTVIITNENDPTIVTLSAAETNVIQIATIGPQGVAGLQGPKGDTAYFDSSSFATTGSNIFNGTQIVSGTLNVKNLLNGQNNVIGADFVHAEGYESNASSNYSHAEGFSTNTFGGASHAEGIATTATGYGSHAEGIGSVSVGDQSHAEGEYTIANGQASHAEGIGTIANGDHQHVTGKYNIPNNVTGAFIIGNGEDDTNRSNLLFAGGNEVDITGLLNVSNGITGSLHGTSSIAIQSLTASYALNAQTVGVGFPFSGSAVITGSLYVSEGITGSLKGTADSASYAQTASYALNSSIVDLTGYTTTSSFNNFTSSVPTNTNFNTFTGSINSFTQSILNWTSSVVTNTVFNSFTQSYNSGSFTGSLKGTADTASYYAETDPIFTAKSASLATTGSNIFRGGQTITGSVDITGSISVAGTYSGWFNSKMSSNLPNGLNGDLGYAALYNFDGYGGPVPNSPDNSWNESVISVGFAGRGLQVAGGYETPNIYFRKGNGVWQGWNRILDSTTDTYAAGMNQSVTTTSQVTFSGITGSLKGTADTASYYAETDPIYNAEKGRYLTTGSSGVTQTILGNLVINQNLTVLGSSSIQYVTSSQLNIGTNIITVNTATPAVRFGGLAVYDSGSTGLTGSILWDSQNNRWIYSNPSGSSYDGGMLLSGPKNTSGLGNEVGTIENVILKGQGGDHVTSSQIIDDGTNVSIAKNLIVTGSITGSLFGTASWATNALTASYIQAAGVVGLNLNSISTGSITASVSTDTNIFGVTSSSINLLSLDNTGKLTVSKSINAGVPDTNQWQSGLEGSYFNNFTTGSNVSEILRFIAGLLSGSAPSPTPNTRTYGGIGEIITNAGTTTAPAGLVPQSSSVADIIYLNNKGFAPTGSTIFVGKTIYNNSGYSISYTSSAAGTTIVSSSADAQLFGLGSLTNGGPTTFKVSGSINWFYSDNNNETQTAVSSSQSEITTNTFGTTNGLTLARINTVNPNVIPAVFQDGKFSGIFSSSLFNGGRSFTSISSSGWYHISASISIASGSSGYTTPQRVTERIFWAPVSSISLPATSPIFGNEMTASLTATSRSLSGAPYLSASTFNIGYTITNAFNPLYAAASDIGTITKTDTLVTVNVPGVSTIGGTISANNVVYDSTGTIARLAGTIPFQNDMIRLTGSITFSAGSSGATNILQQTITPTIFSIVPTSRDRLGFANTFPRNINYHTAGTFGQPLSSGSMAYYGRNQGYDGGTYTGGAGTFSTNFTGESNRVQITDSLLSGSYASASAWNTAFGLYNLGALDLQIKPGFLVKPGGTYGYWLTDPNPSQTYKYYAVGFTRNLTTNQPNITITLAGNTSLVDWTDTTNNTIAMLVIPQSVLATVSQASGIDPKGASTTLLSQGDSRNPFGRSLNVLANTNSQKTNPFIVDFPTTPNAFPLDTTYRNFIILVRYIGDPVPLTSISLTISA